MLQIWRFELNYLTRRETHGKESTFAMLQKSFLNQDLIYSSKSEKTTVLLKITSIIMTTNVMILRLKMTS